MHPPTQTERQALDAAITPTEPPTAAPSMFQGPLTLHFAEWECGHRQEHPEDIPCSSPEQAMLILRAISHAIAQPGRMRAVLMDDCIAHDIYVTDDYVEGIQLDGWYWSRRPLIVHGDAATIERLHAPDLARAREDVLWQGDLSRWDGERHVQADETISTCLTPEQVQQINVVDRFAFPMIRRFAFPPVFRPAADLLAELEAVAADITESESYLVEVQQ